MPWTTGLFTRLYNFVSDAASGIKILASKHDAEFDNIVAGMNSNVITRDGFNGPNNDISWGGKKIVNLGLGVNPTDAATVSQIQVLTGLNQWSPDSSAANYVNNATFNVLARDATTFFHPGRRCLVGYPGGYQHSTVISSTYMAPNTQVNVVLDVGAGAALSTALNRAWYGLIDYANPAYLSPRTAVYAVPLGTQTLTLNIVQKFFFGTENIDALSEYDPANSRFTSRYAGILRVFGNCCIATPITSGSTTIEVFLYRNGSIYGSQIYLGNALNNGLFFSCPFSALIPVSSFDFVEVFLRPNATIIGQLYSTLYIERIV